MANVDVVSTPETVQIEELRIQKENLLQIIHQMRNDMENLTTQLSQRSAVSDSKTETGAPITAGEKKKIKSN